MFDEYNLKEFMCFIDSCIDELIEDVSKEFVSQEKYLKDFSEKSNLYKEINEALPAEMKILFSRYEEKESVICSDLQDFFYKRAFKDAIIVMKTLLYNQNDGSLD